MITYPTLESALKNGGKTTRELVGILFGKTDIYSAEYRASLAQVSRACKFAERTGQIVQNWEVRNNRPVTVWTINAGEPIPENPRIRVTPFVPKPGSCTVRLCVRIRPSDMEALNALSEREGLNVSQIIRRLIRTASEGMR